MKKNILLTLIALMCAIYCEAQYSSYDFQSEGFYYTITRSSKPYTVELTYDYTRPCYEQWTSAIIPATVTYNGKTYSVTSIGNYAFSGCTGLTSITIPESVTSIGSGTFAGCTGLTSVTIPNSVTSIKYATFRGCTGLTSITIPNSVTNIKGGAFDGCTSLTSITIPNNVTNIEGGAFRDCTSLTSVVWNAKQCETNGSTNYPYFSSPFYTYKDSITSITSFIFGNEVESIPDYLCSYMNKLSTVTIPNSVTSIGSSAFFGCTGLTSITIPNSITSIGEWAFGLCTSLTSITIPNSITSIGEYAFYLCTSLTSITIPNNVTGIGTGAFVDCTSLTSVVWNVKQVNNGVGESPFSSYNDNIIPISSFTFGDEVESIPDYLCYGMSNLTSITIPENVTSIGEKAFHDCVNLTSVVWDAKQCKLSGESPFYSYTDSITSITSFTFGDKVENIPPYLCKYMNKLTSITIPNSVTSIEWNAFSNTGLSSISVLAETPPSITYHTFDGVSFDLPVYIPCGTAEAYQTADCWSEFENYIEKWLLYSLTLTTQDNTKGSVRVIKEATSCTDNTAVFEATANEHYHFTRWSDGNTENPRTLVLNQNTSLTAEFAIDRHTITVLAGEHGNVSGAGTYDYGTTVTLTATADEHYHFTQWSDGNTDNPRTVSVEGDATYTAEFAIDQHTISATCDPQQGTVTGAGTYDYGTQVTLTAIANKGYEFAQWSNGVTDNPYLLTATEDLTLEAQFISTTAVENVPTDGTTPQKILRDGQVYILRNGKTYTTTGVEVK